MLKLAVQGDGLYMRTTWNYAKKYSVSKVTERLDSSLN